MNKEINNLDNKQLPKGNPFKTPDDYFDTFYMNLQNKITKKEPFYKRYIFALKPQLSYIILVITFTVIGYTSYKVINNPKVIVTQSVAVNNDITNNELYRIKYNDITEALCESNSQTTTIPTTKDDEIIRYLVDNDINNFEIADAY